MGPWYPRLCNCHAEEKRHVDQVGGLLRRQYKESGSDEEVQDQTWIPYSRVSASILLLGSRTSLPKDGHCASDRFLGTC